MIWVFIVAGGVVLAAFVTALSIVAANRDKMAALKREATAARAAHYEAIKERDVTRSQRDRLNTENAELFAQNADLREALQEKIAEVKRLQMQTVQVQEVPAPTPKRGGRTSRKASTAE